MREFRVYGEPFAIAVAVRAAWVLAFGLLGCAGDVAPPGDGMALLRLAKVLADSGRLDDPGYVGRVMHTSFTAAASPVQAACGQAGVAVVSSSVHFAPAQGLWFRRLPGGTQFVFLAAERPGGARHEVALGAPAFSYSVNEAVGCDARGAKPVTVYADLRFVNVPGFDCVSLDDVKRVFHYRENVCLDDCPSAQYRRGETSVWFYMGVGSRGGAGSFCLIAVDVHLQGDRVRG